MTTPTEVSIAGVPWPTYKLLALAVGLLVLVVVAVVGGTAAPAVLAAAASGAITWMALGVFARR